MIHFARAGQLFILQTSVYSTLAFCCVMRMLQCPKGGTWPADNNQKQLLTKSTAMIHSQCLKSEDVHIQIWKECDVEEERQQKTTVLGQGLSLL